MDAMERRWQVYDFERWCEQQAGMLETKLDESVARVMTARMGYDERNERAERETEVNTLTICQGLPGSGKTTWAKEQVQRGIVSQMVSERTVVRVNRDDIRRELERGGWQWSREGEQQVKKIRDDAILGMLSAGIDVISDDTNLSVKTVRDLQELAKIAGADVQFKSFLDVPIDTCIARDAGREGKARVGEQVIRKMAAEHHIKTGGTSVESPRTVTTDQYMTDRMFYLGKPRLEIQPGYFNKRPASPSSLLAIICDIDGTLAHRHPGRSVYDFSTCDRDVVCEPVRVVLEVFYRFMDWHIVYVSGREELYRPQTETFFRAHHCPPGPLFMRKTGDFRPDDVIKRALYFAHVHEKYRVRFVLDDRDRVVAMWRALGLTCFQVAPGNF